METGQPQKKKLRRDPEACTNKEEVEENVQWSGIATSPAKKRKVATKEGEGRAPPTKKKKESMTIRNYITCKR